MRDSFIAKIIPIGLAVLGVVLLYVWLSADAAMDVTLRLPIAENAPEMLPDESGAEQLRGQLLQFDGEPADLPGAWPRFRGASFDAVSTDDIALARTWPTDGPAVLWSIDVGEGYAGAAVLAGRVYILDYDRENQADAIRCLSLADGKEIWRYWYPVKIKRNHGMSRTVPAVTDKYVVTFGPKCHVTCLDSVTGQFRWMLNLVKDFGAKVPPWYAGQCPLIEDGKAIIAPGGNALMMAVDCETGEIVWQSPNPHGWVMTHSSVMPAEFMGVRMYVYCGSGGVAGVSAEDGSILWESAEWKIRVANVPTPVVMDEGRIFLSGGYNAGSVMLQLTKEDGRISTQEVFRLEPEVFGSPQHTPVFYDGYIYGIRPDGQLTCLDPDGQVVWTSTSAHQFGLGPYTIANGLIYVMNDSGVLTLVDATPSGYVEF
ncbi:MAG: PQQ-binding-like beta-propeller repeat protein, partial [Planctomycetota bacterium]